MRVTGIKARNRGRGILRRSILYLSDEIFGKSSLLSPLKLAQKIDEMTEKLVAKIFFPDCSAALSTQHIQNQPKIGRVLRPQYSHFCPQKLVFTNNFA